MARVLVTGSMEGLGRDTAASLIADGHEVVVHARDARRAEQAGARSRGAAAVVHGDLATADGVHILVEQLDRVGRLDAIVHNAGVHTGTRRDPTHEGHPRIVAVNVLAPYLLTALLPTPGRIIVVSSSMQSGGPQSLTDLDWTQRRWSGDGAYSESKLLVTTLAMALSRRWPDIPVNTVNPGWVPTRMGGPSAPDDLQQGSLTQAWLAVSDDEAALQTGGSWYHRARQRPSSAVLDERFQDQLLTHLADVTGVSLRSTPAPASIRHPEGTT